ncbi:hypothetical protein [Pseudoalteromonas rubra]|nr:hypothetical protein [Pseudoalteromonas rubra]
MNPLFTMVAVTHPELSFAIRARASVLPGEAGGCGKAFVLHGL